MSIFDSKRVIETLKSQKSTDDESLIVWYSELCTIIIIQINRLHSFPQYYNYSTILFNRMCIWKLNVDFFINVITETTTNKCRWWSYSIMIMHDYFEYLTEFSEAFAIDTVPCIYIVLDL